MSIDVCAPKCPGGRRPALRGPESSGDQQDIWTQRKSASLWCHLWPAQHHVQHGLHSDSGELQRPLQPADDELHQGDFHVFIYALESMFYQSVCLESLLDQLLYRTNHPSKPEALSQHLLSLSQIKASSSLLTWYSNIVYIIEKISTSNLIVF